MVSPSFLCWVVYLVSSQSGERFFFLQIFFLQLVLNITGTSYQVPGYIVLKKRSSDKKFSELKLVLPLLQVILLNPVCCVAYAYVSFQFFKEGKPLTLAMHHFVFFLYIWYSNQLL
jgi:hypothetical protein